MFFTYLRRELRRRRRAALVVALGLALGIGLVITVNSVSNGMRDAQDDVLHSLYGVGTDLTVTKEAEPPKEGQMGGSTRQHFDFNKQDMDKVTSTGRLVLQGGMDTLPDSTTTTIAKQDNVAAAVGSLNLMNIKVSGSIHLDQGANGQQRMLVQPKTQGNSDIDVTNFNVTGIDVTQQDVGPLSSSTITSGKSFTSAQANSKVAVVDSAYAKEQKLKVGDNITIADTKFKIIGIATAATDTTSTNVFIPLKQAQTLADLKNKVSTVYVKADSADNISAVQSSLEKTVKGATVTSSSDLADQVSGSLSTASDLATNIGKWLSIAVLLAAFLIASLLTMSAVARRVREFGTLKALGWRSSRVIRQVMGEAFVNGLMGGVLGIALGFAGAAVITAISPTLTASVGSSWGGGGRGGGMFSAGGPASKMGSAAKQTVDIALSAPMTASTIALAVALAIAGGLIAGTFGGWRASRLRPADALRRVE